MDSSSQHLVNELTIQSTEIFNAMPEPAFLLSEDGVYLNVFGGKDAERHHDPVVLKGKSLFDVFPEKLASLFLTYVKEVIESGISRTCQYTMDLSDIDAFKDQTGPKGVRYFEGFLCRVSAGDDRFGVLWTVRCITAYKSLISELKQQKKELMNVSQRDHLTGVYNRVALESVLPNILLKAEKSRSSISALMIDIDYFKQLNEKFGHIRGDKALVQLGDMLNTCFYPDGYCFRYGGDEFLVVLLDHTIDQVQQLAEQFRMAVSDANIANPDSPVAKYLTVTVGVYFNQQTDASLDPDYLVHLADKALINAKADQKNTTYII